MRIATFNVENLDEDKFNDDGKLKGPSLDERIKVLKPQLLRIDADILCLQEVHGQKTEGSPRELASMMKLLEGTQYSGFHAAYTKTTSNEAYDKRNLVVLSKYPVTSINQYLNDLMPDLLYRKVTAVPAEESAKPIGWERPILHVQLETDNGALHIINLHLKSRIPSSIKGQKNGYSYNSVNGWAEGYFISSMKRVGQAIEVRMLIDKILDDDSEAQIVVCGDFNSEPGEVPVEAIVGSVENTSNPDLGFRQLFPCSNSIPSEARYTHLHHGTGNLLDHMLISKAMVSKYKVAEIHNETLHDESIAYATDKKYPESDHAPFVVEFKS